MASAQTTQTGGTQWGQSYTYDGFGNLTDQTVIKGSAPDVHVAYSYLTNRQTGDTADANGNIGSGNIYDLENRLVQPSGSTARYGYDAGNKRMWRGDSGSGVDEIAFWAGQKLATYQVSTSGGLYFTLTSTNVYFGAKLISKGTYNSGGSGDYITLAPVTADRLGSIGKFYPYGTERPSATANDKEKFTGYFRDAATGLDYADQRYEQPGMGRFMTPDPYKKSAKRRNPGTWNRYAYVGGDPVNRRDPNGLCSVLLGGITQMRRSPTKAWASDAGAISAFPYAGGSIPKGLADILNQGPGASQTIMALNAIGLASHTAGPIDIIAFSGGAAAFNAAYNLLTPDEQSRIGSITYIDPASVTALAPKAGVAAPSVSLVGDAGDTVNWILQYLNGEPGKTTGDCGHNLDCVVTDFSQYLPSNGPCAVGAGGFFGGAAFEDPFFIGLNGGDASVEVPLTPHVDSTISYYMEEPPEGDGF